MTFCFCIADANAVFYTGADLNKLAEEENQNQNLSTAMLGGFVIGVVDAYSGISLCPPNGITAGQLIAMVKKEVRINPERWDMPARTIVFLAISKTFPCKK